MRSIICYYSLTGNTKKIAKLLEGKLSKKGSVDLIELKPLNESSKFLSQAARAFLKKKVLLSAVKTNLSGYDLICFGTPVWAFGPTPAIRTFLENCSGLQDKTIILFITSGGAGNERCFREMRNVSDYGYIQARYLPQFFF